MAHILQLKQLAVDLVYPQTSGDDLRHQLQEQKIINTSLHNSLFKIYEIARDQLGQPSGIVQLYDYRFTFREKLDRLRTLVSNVVEWNGAGNATVREAEELSLLLMEHLLEANAKIDAVLRCWLFK